VRVIGSGVGIVADELRTLNEADLRPVRSDLDATKLLRAMG
jgi:hypothetical protein